MSRSENTERLPRLEPKLIRIGHLCGQLPPAERAERSPSGARRSRPTSGRPRGRGNGSAEPRRRLPQGGGRGLGCSGEPSRRPSADRGG